MKHYLDNTVIQRNIINYVDMRNVNVCEEPVVSYSIDEGSTFIKWTQDKVEVRSEQLDTENENFPILIPIEQKIELLKKCNELVSLFSKGKLNARIIYIEEVKDIEYKHIGVKEREQYYVLSFRFHQTNFVYESFISNTPFLLSMLEPLIDEIVEKRIIYTHAHSVTPDTYDILMSPDVASAFIHEVLGHKVEADFAITNGFLEKRGEYIASEHLTVMDGRGPDTPFTRQYDDEGTLREKTIVIKDGKLVSLLHSLETAFQLRENPTGNGRAESWVYSPLPRMSDIYILPGERSPEQMIESIKKGIYLECAGSGSSPGRGFSIEVPLGWTIENGKKVKPLKDIIFSGDVFETLKKIEPSSDFQWVRWILPGKDRVSSNGCLKYGQQAVMVIHGSPSLLVRNGKFR